MAKLAIDFRDLNVYRTSMDTAMEVRSLTLGFPSNERYSLTDQMTRSSRSVCANIAESEASETRVWLEFAYKCDYLDQDGFERLDDRYDHICRMLSRMTQTADKWTRSGN